MNKYTAANLGSTMMVVGGLLTMISPVALVLVMGGIGCLIGATIMLACEAIFGK